MAPQEQSRSSQSGAALILVLSVVALLSVMVIAYLGSSAKQMNLSQNVVVNLKGTEVASLASGQILQDLLQEIRAGSVEKLPTGATSPILYPATALGAAPDRSSAFSSPGTPPPPNLLKKSAFGKKSYDSGLLHGTNPVYPQATLYPVVARASKLASDFGPGAVSKSRWNRPLLLPRDKPGQPFDFTPAPTGWKAPDWVYLQRNGANPLGDDPSLSVNGANPVVARYAFQMYDIGGLLDLNVAGYDPDANVVGPVTAARRGSIGLADLTKVGFTADQLKKIVAQRNPATLGEKDNPTGQLSFGNRYVNFLMDSQKNLGFLRVAGDTGNSGATNRAFSSRQGLLSYVQQLGTTDAEKAKLVDTLQSLTHFSRSLEQPSFKPGFFNPTAAGSTPKEPVFSRPSIVPPKSGIDDALHESKVIPDSFLSPNDLRKNVTVGGPLPFEMSLGNNRGGNNAWGTFEQRVTGSRDKRSLQDVINPGFLEVRVGKGFTRLDGTAALPGEPLVKKRFPLERLAWLTYKGPSALLPDSDEQYNPGGTVIAIYDSFGLTWTKDKDGYWFWAYNHGLPGNIYKLEDLTTPSPLPATAPRGAKGMPREPDFFELLKATIGVGSLGKPATAQHRTGQSWDVATYYQARDRNSNFQLLEIAANIIDQYDADSFPTLIRLPGSTAQATAYSPPLFTARGTEDIPYFYRFHWRGIEDAKDRPNKVLPNNAPLEITGNIGSYSGAAFRCGTTFLMGFPELWNPHALNGAGVPASLAPTQFRVVAASETPQDMIDPLLLKLPKLGNLPKGNPTVQTDPARLWWHFFQNNWTDFTIQPTGHFAYKLYNTSTANQPPTQTWLYEWNQFYFSTQSAYMALNGNNWTWNWPIDNLQTTAVAIGTLNADNRSKGLFWCDPTKYVEEPGKLRKNARVTNYFLAVAPMWKIPTGVGSDADFLTKCMLPMPAGWPDDTFQFRGKTFTGPLPVGPFDSSNMPDAAALYRVDAANAFTFDLSSNTFEPIRWPLSPDPFKLFSTASYTVGDGIRGPGPITLQGGGSFYKTSAPPISFATGYKSATEPNFPPYRTYVVALTDRPGTSRALLESNSGSVLAPMTGPLGDGKLGGGNQGNNRVVDMRGTELTFSLGNNQVFREPSVLCQPGVPAGSSLAAGPDNFFAKAPYGGSVQGVDGADWVGFSMGEIPSQFIVMAKMFKRDKPAGVNKWGRDEWYIDGDDPALDVFQNKRGKELTNPSPDYKVTGPNVPADHYKLRFFHFPTNIAGLRNSTKFTVRLQYKDPVSEKWVTYDERFMETDSQEWGRWTSMPVLGKPEITPVGHPPQDFNGNVAWKDLKRPIGWNAPLITSYDPRSPRFGHPMRYGYNWPDSIRGTSANRLQHLNPSPSLLTDTGFFPETTPLIGKHNKTDRPDSALVDLPSGSKALTTTPRFLAPAYWHNWIYWNYDSEPYKSVYDYVTGNKPPYYIPGKTPSAATLVYGPQWWAKGVDPRTGKPIYQFPSGNAYDYGWLPRLADPAPAGSLPRTSVPWSKGDITPDKTLPNFWQDAPGGAYADAFRIGDFSENVAPSPASNDDPNAPYRQAYADPDDVVRRASGALASLGKYSTTVPIEGLPQGQGKTAAASNRPIMLNRPFRAVAEMGAAFRGSPWKHLDFFLPESADAALLDVFCLTEPPPLPVKGNTARLSAAPPLIAGKVSLNTRQLPVLKAMLAGALKDETTPASVLSDRLNAEVDMAARALVDRTTGNKPWQGPLTNNAELVGKLFAKDLTPLPAKTDPVYTATVYKTNTEPDRNPDIGAGKTTLTWHFSGLSADLDKVFSVSKDRKTKRFRESVIRALADGGQTRVWNLMLDIVVQPGRLTALESKLEKFVKEGETRLWVFLSVDRLTGEVLDQQFEWVTD
jgi:hypothetical protein